MPKAFENKEQSSLPGKDHLNSRIVPQSSKIYPSDSMHLRGLSVSDLPDGLQADEHWTAVTRYLVDMYLPKEG